MTILFSTTVTRIYDDPECCSSLNKLSLILLRGLSVTLFHLCLYVKKSFCFNLVEFSVPPLPLSDAKNYIYYYLLVAIEEGLRTVVNTPSSQ